VLGFLDLQSGQAQNRFYTELEDWLATTVRDLDSEGGTVPALASANMSADIKAAIERLREVIADSGSSKAATNAMANLAEAIQGLVQHMRSEQQMIRNWADAQAEQHTEVRRLLEVLARERHDA
jgi:predicted RNase H-like HicB family nuclease